jgi:uncharacterized membrane protein (DUF4010 family)
VNHDLYLRPGLALAIGLLVGLQRERVKEGPAGIRTFALIALGGFFTGYLGLRYGGLSILGGLLFLAAILSVGNVIDSRKHPEHGSGATTEIAALLVFLLGIYLADPANEPAPAVIFTGVIALLLQYKRPLHQFVRGLGPEDVQAIMQFILITLVVLPVLPNRTFGPYDVFNPHQAWLMIVLIVGIGLAGYLAQRIVGSRAGTLTSGILGGLVSSTATSVSASRFARENADRVTAAALIVLLSSSVSVARILVEMAVVNGRNLLQTGPPVALFLLVFVALTFLLYRRRSAEVLRPDPPANPAGLKPALLFGFLYVVILIAVAAAKEHAGTAGLYGIAVLSGLTDVDAITLSTAGLVDAGKLDPATGWRTILIAAMANLAFKSATVAVIGGKLLFLRILPVLAAVFATGLVLLVAWG